MAGAAGRVWIGIPAAIEEHQHGADVVPGDDGEELVNSAREAGRVLLPQEIVEEHAHRVHVRLFGPAQFEIDARGIEARRLPPLEFVDRRRGDVVRADEPWLAIVPGVGGGGGPELGRSRGGDERVGGGSDGRGAREQEREQGVGDVHGSAPHG